MTESLTQYGDETEEIYYELLDCSERDDNANDYTTLVGRGFIQKEDWGKLFRRKLLGLMRNCGYVGDDQSDTDIRRFLVARCRETGIDLEPNSIKNWVTNNCMSTTANGIINAYKLCFALQADMLQTEDFFKKALLIRPNRNSLYESVCLFCLNNRMRFDDVDRIIHIVNDLQTQIDDAEIDQIEFFSGSLSDVKTEDDFIEYWLQYVRKNEIRPNHNLTEFKSLRDECFTISGIDKQDALLSQIYGYPLRKSTRSPSVPQVKLKSEINELSLSHNQVLDKYSIAIQQEIRRNFPQSQQINNIVNQQKTSGEAFRKALIVHNFYLYFMTKAKEKENRKKNDPNALDDFTKKTNSLLKKCGCASLYPPNPFDAMFIYCAARPKEDPLIVFQSLVSYLFSISD